MSGERRASSQTATRAEAGDPSPSVTARGTGPSREGVRAHATPAQIGRFVVLRKLGEGGMGVVYAAYDEELERKVAIKVLRGEYHGQRQSIGVARLQREAQAMARLSHPNIVQVYEAGGLGNGVFIAMEFVHGSDLREWRLANARSWRTVLAVYMQAGQGLAAAHAAGIVHRDFKPDNVLIGEDERVRVVDFGLARPGDAPPEEPAGVSSSRLAVEITQAGSFIGTPAYMAPEQLRRELADAKSDQFSFCVTLYEALYGFRPFPGADTASLREAVLYDEPLPPPRGSDVPGWVHQALLRGLRREPERRWHDMTELLAALAADPSVRRRRRLGIAGVALASGLAAGGGGVAVYELRAASERACVGGEARLAGVWDGAVAEATRAAILGTRVRYAEDVATRVQGRLDAYAKEWVGMHREACETHRRGEQSDALFDLRMACLDERRTSLGALVDVLADADAEMVTQVVQAAENMPSLARCEDTQALLARSPPPEDPATARAVEALRGRVATAWAKHAVGQVKVAATEAIQLREEAETLGYQPLLAEVLRLGGICADDLGDYGAAEVALVRAVAATDAAGDDELRARSQLDLVRVVGARQQRFAEGARYAELTRGTLARVGDTGPLTALIESSLAELSLQQGAYGPAQEHIERSIELQRQLHGEDSSGFANAISARGSLRYFRGELAGALADYQESLKIYEELFGVHHPILGAALNNVGAVELTQYDNDAAERTFVRAQQILEEAYGGTHPSLGTLHANLGMIAVLQGRASHGVAELRRALEIFEKHMAASHPTIAFCLKELSEAYLFAGELRAAQETGERSIEVHVAAYGAGHAKVAVAVADLGMVLLRMKDAAGAERAFVRARTEHRGEADAPELGRAYVGLGMLARAQGRVDEAVRELESGLERLQRNSNEAPYHVAEAQFELAQALWQRGRGDEKRVRSLAADAQHNYGRVGPGFAAEVAKVHSWSERLPSAG